MSRDNRAASRDLPQEFRLITETISGASLKIYGKEDEIVYQAIKMNKKKQQKDNNKQQK